ncbi:MAG: sugar phosphate isomerase/epimerase [Candidatus Glassbacteria bacterium]|nr:sugar phosphate isomerase/epimerase [Candidatus Glassbacteria bacterium]
MQRDGKAGNGRLSRRQLMVTGIAGAGALGLNAIGACQAQQGSQAKEEGALGKPTRNMKLSLAAYSMRQALSAGEIDLFDFIDWCAELDLQGTELTSYYFRENVDNAYLHQLKLHAFRQGLAISGTAVGNNFCLAPGSAERKEQIDHVKQWIDYAAEMDAPHIRVFAGRAPDNVELDIAIGWAADGIKECLEYAEKHGVVLGLENHGGITARARDHLAICDRVGDHPNFGVNLDSGNYRTDCYEELAMAAPRSVNVQIKVTVSDNDRNRVPTDMARVRDILVNAGYQGWVALEYEEKEDPKVAIPRYIAEMKKLYLGV